MKKLWESIKSGCPLIVAVGGAERKFSFAKVPLFRRNKPASQGKMRESPMYQPDPIWISTFLNDILDTRSRGEGRGRPPRNAQLLTLLLLLWGKWGCMQGAGGAGGGERLMRRFQGVPTVALAKRTPTHPIQSTYPLCRVFLGQGWKVF